MKESNKSSQQLQFFCFQILRLFTASSECKLCVCLWVVAFLMLLVSFLSQFFQGSLKRRNLCALTTAGTLHRCTYIPKPSGCCKAHGLVTVYCWRNWVWRGILVTWRYMSEASAVLVLREGELVQHYTLGSPAQVRNVQTSKEFITAKALSCIIG